MKAFLRKVFCGNIALYLALLAVFCAGLILGIIFCDALDGLQIVSEEYYLVIFDSGSILKIFLSRLLNGLFLCLIFSATFLSPFFLIASFAALLYRGFVLGTALITIITCAGVAGVLICIFLVIPTQVLLHFILLSLSASGVCQCRKLCLNAYFSTLLIFYLSVVSVALCEIAAIFLIIRPLTIVL